jgi:long-chain fatty acid transport protein
MNTNVDIQRLLFTTWIFFTFPISCFATNGLNAIGFGAESVSMGGADLALARDTTALNSNPAGLSQIKNKRLDISPFIAFTGDVFHRDPMGNDEANNNTPLMGGNFGYAKRLKDSNLVFGVGLFAQGGAGSEFENLTTIFGNQDELSTLLGIVRVTPGFAYTLNDRVSFGASLILSASISEQKVFPNTSFFNATNPSASFFGQHGEDAIAFGSGFKLGTLIKLTSNTTLGIAYTSKIELKQEDGVLHSNQTSIGRGIVNYDDVTTEGLHTPREIGIGIATQVHEKLLVSAELNWLNWSDAINSIRFTARNPDNPAASDLDQTSPHDWSDQWVVALGGEYITDSGIIIRAGYNYGEMPVPVNNFSPLLGGNNEHHFTAGFSYKINDTWLLNGSLEYLVDNTVTYTNPLLPFGTNASNGGDVYVFQLMFSRFW